MGRLYHSPFDTSPGFTLVEIMVVITIISILLGIGSAVFTHSGQKLALKIGTGQTATLLQKAKNYSLQEGTSSTVKIFKNESVMELWGQKLVGCWHLEDITTAGGDKMTTGAFGFHGKIKDAALSEGKFGKCLRWDKAGGRLECGDYGRFSLSQGFTLSLWIYPERPMDKQLQILWQIGDAYVLGITSEQSLNMKVFGMDVSPTDCYLPVYQWVHIRLVDDTTSISLWISHSLVKQTPYKPMPIHSSMPITAGSHFRGKIDEIKLYSHIVLDSLLLPEDIMFKSAPKEIAFDERGLLDVRNLGNSTIVLERSSTKEQSQIDVSALGRLLVQKQDEQK